MDGTAALGIVQFSFIYVLLIIVLIIMKKSKVNQTKLVLVASIRMTFQLVLVGYILKYIFSNPRPIFTIIFITLMIIFSINRVINSRQDLNKNFKVAIAVALIFSGLSILSFFVVIVVNESVFNPQYTIPLAGMIIGN